MDSTMMDRQLCVATLLRYGTTMHGGSEVVTDTGDGSRRASYAAVGERAARLASALRELGVSGDQRVATFQWNNQEHLEAYLAVPSMGAVLHTLNIRLSPEQLVYIANHAEDRVVLVDASLLPLLARVLPQLRTVRHVVVVGAADTTVLEAGGKEIHSYAELLAGGSPDFVWPDVDERSAAAMCYTSGTTGNPKGVVYSHRSTYLHSMAMCMGDALALSAADRVLPVVPMFHVNAWGLPYAAMMVGASLVMPDRFLQAEPLARLIAAERPTLAAAVPTIWGELLRYVDAQPADLSSLRLVLCGGAPVPHALMEAFESRHGVRVLQGWGMTETSPVGTIARPPAGLPPEQEWAYRGTAGRLVCAVEGRIVGEAGQVLPCDGKAVGEIEVRGPWVTGGYYREDDSGRFADGWLRTGDVGSIDPMGFVTISDRAKDVIKSGGEWISSVDLENALMAHPDVVEAAVVAVPDDRWQERPLATVVVRDGAAVTPVDLRGWLAKRFAPWQLPERWAFLAEVPRTSVGKFDKKVIRRRYADGRLPVSHTPGASDQQT